MTKIVIQKVIFWAISIKKLLFAKNKPDHGVFVCADDDYGYGYRSSRKYGTDRDFGGRSSLRFLCVLTMTMAIVAT